MSEETDSLCCGKSCACNHSDGLNRRDFLKVAAIAAGGAGMAGTSNAAATDTAALDAWNRTLFDRGERRVYRGDELQKIAMPLGGIGCGQVYLRGDGTLNPWQIVNNFSFGANAPGSFFAAWSRRRGGPGIARLLQLHSMSEARGIDAIEFSGEFPFAWLRYLDQSLPVDVRLEAFSPFIPLNEKDSAIPAVLFRFTLHNPSQETVEAALLGAAPNLVGWDGYASLHGVEHGDYGFNTNSLDWRERGVASLNMSAREGAGHAVDKPVRLLTNNTDVAYHMRHCTNVQVRQAVPIPIDLDGDNLSVHWLADVNGTVTAAEVDHLLDAVEGGATAVITNDENALALLTHGRGRKDKAEVFEDWASGSYDNWTIQGDCFGSTPASGTLPGQQEVSGWDGKFYVNTFNGGDGTTGKATSRTFTISKKYIRLRVGGGDHAGETCVNLVVDGQIVATATGENVERLRPVLWDVSQHKGKEAAIDIVDSNTGGWGHILVGNIEFSDSPQQRELSQAVRERYRSALPISWQSISSQMCTPLAAGSHLLNGVKSGGAATTEFPILKGVRVKRGARVVAKTEDGTPAVVTGTYGKGTLVMCLGVMEKPFAGFERKAVIGNIIAEAALTAYHPMTGVRADYPLAGSLALAVLDADCESKRVTARPQWDDFQSVWLDFVDGGEISYAGADHTPSRPGRTWNGSICARVTLGPNESREITFVLAWHFPNRTRDNNYGWGPGAFQYDYRLGNQYNTWFKNAGDVVDYVAVHRERLAADTVLFHKTLYDSTLPRYFLDTVSANASTIHSPIYVWLEDGAVGGFEGADHCCPMNCTHVYNYAMSMAYLFPALERKVRETDLLVQMHPTEHYIPHRTVLPLSAPRLGDKIGGPQHPALDGELGTVLKTYREWRLCGDRSWLEKLWGRSKTLMFYIMERHDPEGKGLIQGEQPNTYDTHLFGSNTFIGTLYLAALRASEEMARIMDDSDAAKKFRERFDKGYDAYDKTCWNGQYYYNVFDAPNADANTYNSVNCYGPGCFADQLFGQWWAFSLGLGYVLPEKHVHQGLRALHRNNWLPDLSNHHHNQRVFAEGEEKGLLCCTWPQGGRPEKPILYCDEVWTGIEYHVAASLIYAGMATEGMQIVRGARDRYTGNQRNPWAEIECGYHYARAMSAHSLLSAAGGLEYDAASGSLAMIPRMMPDNYRGFFSTNTGWGTVAQTREPQRQRNNIEVAYGELAVSSVSVACHSSVPKVRVLLDEAPVLFSHHVRSGNISVKLIGARALRRGERVTIEQIIV